MSVFKRELMESSVTNLAFHAMCRQFQQIPKAQNVTTFGYHFVDPAASPSPIFGGQYGLSRNKIGSHELPQLLMPPRLDTYMVHATPARKLARSLPTIGSRLRLRSTRTMAKAYHVPTGRLTRVFPLYVVLHKRGPFRAHHRCREFFSWMERTRRMYPTLTARQRFSSSTNTA
jgi:hypothetical protein